MRTQKNIPKEKRENKDCECFHGFVYKEVEGNDDETDNNK